MTARPTERDGACPGVLVDSDGGQPTIAIGSIPEPACDAATTVTGGYPSPRCPHRIGLGTSTEQRLPRCTIPEPVAEARVLDVRQTPIAPSRSGCPVDSLGFEPRLPGCKPGVLPLDYEPVAGRRIEPRLSVYETDQTTRPSLLQYSLSDSNRDSPGLNRVALPVGIRERVEGSAHLERCHPQPSHIGRSHRRP